MEQDTTSVNSAAASDHADLMRQWRFAVVHLADMVRLHEALLGLPGGGTPSRMAALAELDNCIEEARSGLELLAERIERQVPVELLLSGVADVPARPDGPARPGPADLPVPAQPAPD